MKQQNSCSDRIGANPPLKPANHFEAFTLIECLICMAIVSLLMAILYAALAPARARGGSTRCLGNLWQIGMALQMYRQDYGGADPPRALTAEQLGLPVGNFPVGYYLEPYVKGDGKGANSLFWCDIGDGHAQNPYIFGDTNYMCPFQLP